MFKMKRKIGEKGQLVIPRDIRHKFKWDKGTTIEIEVIENGILIKQEKDPEKIVSDFFTIARSKKGLTLKDLKKIEEESYDLP
jgi:AbrB family looped-hinge helix DNA binding protein